MHSGRLVFSQLMDYLPREAFDRCVRKYSGNYNVQHFTCRSQFLCMAFGQLTYRNGLRDIVTCLRAHRNKLYHMGIRCEVSRNNLSNANMTRDWRIYAEFAQVLIDIARKLYAGEKFSEEISEPVYALDSTTISLALSLFPWAEFRETRGGIKTIGISISNRSGNYLETAYLSQYHPIYLPKLTILPETSLVKHVFPQTFTDFHWKHRIMVHYPLKPDY